jgi:hypothetical protein
VLVPVAEDVFGYGTEHCIDVAFGFKAMLLVLTRGPAARSPRGFWLSA